MKIAPILYQAPMVRALLERRKIQTRRMLDAYCEEPPAFVLDGRIVALDERDQLYRWPRTHAIGDRLWVREAVAAHERKDGVDGVFYLADDAFLPIGNTQEAGERWVTLRRYRGRIGATVPPIHMPRWVSRIVNTVVDVRVVRLQDISEADAVYEGWPTAEERARAGTAEIRDAYPIGWYAALWESIHGIGSWKANPWVAAYTFTIRCGNVDTITDEEIAP